MSITMGSGKFKVRSGRVDLLQVIGAGVLFSLVFLFLLATQIPTEDIPTFATAFGAVFAPFVVFIVGRDYSRRRATAELIKSLTTTTEIMARMERLYRYRKLTEGKDDYDPYASGAYSLIYDHVVVLNFFEAVCREIKDDQVDSEMIYYAGGNTIIGVEDVLLTRLNDLLQEDQNEDYKALIEVCAAFQARASRKNETIRERIPDRIMRS